MYEGHIENGVVVFDEPVSLPDGTLVRVEAVTNGASEPVKPAPGLARTLAARWKKFLSHTVDLPADAAAQHDHYLYGTPKK